MRDVAELIVSQRDELAGLVFEPDSFCNASSYRISYNIPDNEKLLVYAYSECCRDALAGTGTFITDEAIYVHPTVRSERGQERIPLKDICSFIVLKNENSEVKLFGEQQQYRIFTAVRKSRDTAASALVSLISAIQSSLMMEKTNKDSYRRTVKRIYTIIRSQLRQNGTLQKEYLSLLEIMEDVAEFRRESIFLQLENEYRNCDNASYNRLLESKRHLLNDENIKVLSSPDELFFTGFISDLADAGSYSDVKSIIDAYLRLKAMPRLSLYEASILLYLCVRMEDYAYVEELLKEVGDDLEQNELWRFFSFYSEYKNHRMHMNMAKMASLGAVGDATRDELFYTNDIGLCSVHYALLLGNSDIVRHILPLADWTSLKSPLEKDRICACLYDPMFIAVLRYKDEALLREIFMHTSPKATAIVRAIKGMDAMIDINTKLKKKYPDQQKVYAERVEEYRSMRREMKAELKSLTKAELRRQKKLYGIIKDADHPFANYLLDLYTDPKGLISWLSHISGSRKLLKYKQLFFAAGADFDTPLSYCEYREDGSLELHMAENDKGYRGTGGRQIAWDQRRARVFDNPAMRQFLEEERRKAEEKRRRREEFLERVSQPSPYAGSWFSEAAHENITLLKEEYRVLVKKYHPDSSGDEGTAKILLRIMTERADILDHIRGAG